MERKKPGIRTLDNTLMGLSLLAAPIYGIYSGVMYSEGMHASWGLDGFPNVLISSVFGFVSFSVPLSLVASTVEHKKPFSGKALAAGIYAGSVMGSLTGLLTVQGLASHHVDHALERGIAQGAINGIGIGVGIYHSNHPMNNPMNKK